MPKAPKNRYIPRSDKKPRSSENVDALIGTNFQWKIDRDFIDIEHEEWGWVDFSFRDFISVVFRRFCDFETMTWQEITKRTSCHPMPITEICSRAQVRITQLHPDVDILHQLDTSELGRVWGWRDRSMFYLIWYDPKHTVCPFK